MLIDAIAVKSDEGNRKDISYIISDRYVASNYRRDARSFALKSKSELYHPSETTDTGTRLNIKSKLEEEKTRQEENNQLCEESKDSVSETDSKRIAFIQ